MSRKDITAGLQSISTVAQIASWDVVDRSDNELLGLIADVSDDSTVTVHPDSAGDYIQYEAWAYFAEVRKWIDQRTTQDTHQVSWRIPHDEYECTFSLSRRVFDGDGPNTGNLVEAARLAAATTQVFVDQEVDLVYDAMSSVKHPNGLICYDNQDLFSATHQHPNGKPFSNLLAAARADNNKPTQVEAREEIKRGKMRLGRNRVVSSRLRASGARNENLLIICRSDDVELVLQDLLEEERIAGEINRFRGTFKLHRDENPPPGTEHTFDMIDTSSPIRPSVLKRTRLPMFEIERGDAFHSKMIDFGTDASMAIGSGLPHPAVRIQ